MPETLADRAARIAAEAESAARVRRIDGRRSRRARVSADIRSSATFVAQASAGAWWLWERVGRPLASVWWRVAKRAIAEYRKLWAWSVYRRDEDDSLVFSKVRAGVLIATTVGFGWFCLVPSVECAWDGIIYALTARTHEHVYLLGSQEIDSWTGAHVIEGCSRLPCSDRDAVYFRTAGGLFNNIWSLSHGRGLFYPEYVGAAVPYQTSRCDVTSYGVRMRLPFRIVNTYSYLLAVTCSPLEGENRS